MSGRVLVLRYAPDPLDGRVARDQPLHFVHVRPAVEHAHVQHLEAERLGDREMPVVAGHDAEETRPRRFAPPGRLAFQRSVEPGVQQVLVHEGEAGVPAGNHLRRIHAEQGRAQAPRGGQAVEPAVVARVGAAGREVGAVQGVLQPVRQVELLGARFPAGEIQLETELLQRGVLARERALCGGKVGVEGQVGRHGTHYSRAVPVPYPRTSSIDRLRISTQRSSWACVMTIGGASR